MALLVGVHLSHLVEHGLLLLLRLLDLHEVARDGLDLFLLLGVIDNVPRVRHAYPWASNPSGGLLFSGRQRGDSVELSSHREVIGGECASCCGGSALFVVHGDLLDGSDGDSAMAQLLLENLFSRVSVLAQRASPTTVVSR
jgi:hypothetical protein